MSYELFGQPGPRYGCENKDKFFPKKLTKKTVSYMPSLRFFYNISFKRNGEDFRPPFC
jgi:hypothetical protein